MEKRNVLMKSFPYKGNSDKGLFSFLRESKRYPLVDNMIPTNSSFKDRENYNIYTPFGITNKYAWHSGCEENSWLKMSFPNFKVKVDSYSMKSHENFPTSWCLEAKNEEDADWTNVSFVEGRITYDASTYEHVNCTKENYFTEYRIKMLGKRTYHFDYCFEILRLEFFGSIMTKPKYFSCFCRRIIIVNSFLGVIIVLLS